MDGRAQQDQLIHISASNEIIQKAEEVINGLIAGSTFSSATNFTEKMGESLYSRGYVQYHQGRYEDASKTFGYIIFNDPSNVRAMRGLASSLQMLGKHHQALLFLSYAAVADDDNADISLQVVECMLHIGQKRDAQRLLSDIEKALKNDPKDEYIRQKAKGLRELLGSMHDR